MSLDLDALMADISADDPCGEDLVYDSDFIQFETDFAGKPEVVMGDSVQEAEEPDWSSVRRQAIELLGRTRDLRLIISLTVAEMKTEGLTGMRDGLKLLQWAIDERWDSVHPQLDPDDDNDPLERVNVLAAMSSPLAAPGDPTRFRERFSQIPLIQSRVLGPVTLRDIHRSEDPEAAPGEDGETSDARRQRIAAITMESDSEEIQAQHEAMSEILESMKAIDSRLTDLVGASQAANFEGVLQDLGEALSNLSGWAGASGGGESDGDSDDAGGDFSGGGGGMVGVGEIRSSADVQTAFDRIVQYYDRHEPSSPVPVIVKMAQSLLGKSFLDISSAMSSDAVETIERVREIAAGVRDADEE